MNSSSALDFGTPDALDTVALDALAEYVHKRFGIFVTPDKRGGFRFSIEKACRILGARSIAELHVRVTSGPKGACDCALADAVSVNHTAFFRESAVLDYFRDEVLANRGNDPLKIWSAAASTGEEAYTIAMMSCEQRGMAGASNVAILGTDISEKCLRHATMGVYDHERTRTLSPKRLMNYFQPHGQRHLVRPMLRNMCMFRRMNLKMHPWPFHSKFDVVFCRNVLYYFDEKQQVDILEHIKRFTTPDAFLFTSVTEIIRDVGKGWTTEAPGVHRKVGR